MSDTIRFFRDRLTIDLDLITKLAVPGTGTLVFGAREVELAALLPSYHYVIAADHLTVPPHAGTSLVGDSPKVTVLTLDIAGALQVTCAGFDGPRRCRRRARRKWRRDRLRRRRPARQAGHPSRRQR
jgi:hypothetical protein